MARGDGRIFLRGQTWWASYYLRGKEFRESTGETDETKAEKFLQGRMREVGADVIGARKFVPPRSSRLTIRDLVEALRQNYELRDKLSAQSANHLDRVVRDFGDERAMTLIAEPQRIDKYITERKKNGDALASIQRTLQLLSQSFKLAIGRGQLNQAPAITRVTVKNVRTEFIEDTEFKTLLSHLPDDGLRDFCDWLGTTGMRRGEASLLRWDMVHGDELRIPGTICKNAHPRNLPLTDELAAIIERLRAARSYKAADGSTKFSSYIFHRGDGKQICLFRKSWATACKKAGCPSLVPHDLRRVAARRLVKSGVQQSIARQVTGHETDSMFNRYAIFKTEDIREAMEQAAEYRQIQEKKAAAKAAERAKIVSMP